MLSDITAETVALVGDRAWIRTWTGNSASALVPYTSNADAIEPSRRTIAVYHQERISDRIDATSSSNELTLGFWSLPSEVKGSSRVVWGEHEPELPQSPYHRLRAEFREFALSVASRDDVARLSAEVALLGAKIVDLASVVERSKVVEKMSVDSVYDVIEDIPSASVKYIDSALITAALKDENILANLLKLIADQDVKAAPEIVSVAEQHLNADSAVLRAAAGRALSATAPERALSILPSAISAETNKVTRSLLRGALRAAQQ